MRKWINHSLILILDFAFTFTSEILLEVPGN